MGGGQRDNSEDLQTLQYERLLQDSLFNALATALSRFGIEDHLNLKSEKRTSFLQKFKLFTDILLVNPHDIRERSYLLYFADKKNTPQTMGRVKESHSSPKGIYRIGEATLSFHFHSVVHLLLSLMFQTRAKNEKNSLSKQRKKGNIFPGEAKFLYMIVILLNSREESIMTRKRTKWISRSHRTNRSQMLGRSIEQR